MKKISPKKYAQALYQATNELGYDEIKMATENFIRVLIKNKNLRLIDKIIKEFIKYDRQEKGILDVQVISAEKLTGVAQKELAEQIKAAKRVNKIEIENLEDKSLIGGLIIKIGDEVLDASLRTRLSLLKNNLK